MDKRIKMRFSYFPYSRKRLLANWRQFLPTASILFAIEIDCLSPLAENSQCGDTKNASESAAPHLHHLSTGQPGANQNARRKCEWQGAQLKGAVRF